MRRLICWLFTICLGAGALAQTHADLKPYIPKGYQILFEYTGDLNMDSIPDKMLVIGIDKSLGDSVLKKYVPHESNYQKRPLLILLGQTNHTFVLAGQNEHAIVQNLGVPDPFTTIYTASGTFTIQHVIADGNSKCIVAARFEWSLKQKDWFLISYSHTCAAANVLPGSEGEVFKEKTPKNFGKLRFEKYKYPMDIEVDEWGQ
ncbi:MAG TPA: hypothetical protein VNZ86_05485 [Bacteroidia bacterium]|jgi:hypothetical protein|nr:hypothetical protein [Bacteroidia bacterium]